MTPSKLSKYHLSGFYDDFSFFPVPEEYGMDLAPNTASSIAVQLNQVFMLFLLNTFLIYEYFQIHRQPDPYVSHCVDSWANTGIQVPASTNYSQAVDRCSKHT